MTFFKSQHLVVPETTLLSHHQSILAIAKLAVVEQDDFSLHLFPGFLVSFLNGPF